MIIELLLDAIYGLFNTLTSVINLPKFPPEASTYIDQFVDYISAGVGIVANYAPLGYLLILFAVIAAIDVGIKSYYFTMWILKKIPFLGIE